MTGLFSEENHKAWLGRGLETEAKMPKGAPNIESPLCNCVFVLVFLLGGVGFDINCGVRLLRTNLDEKDVQPVKEQLAQVSVVLSSLSYHGD